MEHVNTIKALITTAFLVFAAGFVWLMLQRPMRAPKAPATTAQGQGTRRERRLVARLCRRLERQARVRHK